jgi:hypothetical protein
MHQVGFDAFHWLDGCYTAHGLLMLIDLEAKRNRIGTWIFAHALPGTAFPLLVVHLWKNMPLE